MKSLICLTGCLAFAPLGWTEPPNILLVISDDMGYSDPGCYGGEIRTPQLDALAAEGLRFTNFYVNNMCFPTRASLMTGLYPKSVFLKSGNPEDGMASQNTTLPEALKRAGYSTFMAGKWHLSSHTDTANQPHNRGFDKYYGSVEGTVDYFAPAYLQLNDENREWEWRDNPDYYYTDRLTDNAIGFLKDSEGPFFLYLAYNAAHWPLHALPEDIARYKGTFSRGWDELRQERYQRMLKLGVIEPHWKLSDRNPDVPAWEDEPHKAWQERRMEVYAAQVTSMDRNIARVVDYLKQTGQYENTLILYMHDNGGCHVEYDPKRTGSWTKPYTTDGRKTPIIPGNLPENMPGPQSVWQSYGYGWANLSNTPFRNYKQFDHEGGTRSPLIVSWPARIPGSRSGNLIHQVSHAIDLMPTLLEVAGLDPIQQNPVPLQGQSLFRNFIGQDSDTDRTLYWQHSRGRAVREGDWKLVSPDKGDSWELYNLGADGTEMRDLSAESPERFQKMKRMHEQWMKSFP